MPAQMGNNPHYYGRAEGIDPTYLYLLQLVQNLMGQVRPNTGDGIYNPFAWMDAGGLTFEQKRLADEARATASRQQAADINASASDRRLAFEQQQEQKALQDQIDAMTAMLAAATGQRQSQPGVTAPIMEFQIPGGTSGRMSDTKFGQAGIPTNVRNAALLLNQPPIEGESQESYLQRAGVDMPTEQKPGPDWGSAPQEAYENIGYEMLTGRGDRLKGETMPPVGGQQKQPDNLDQLLFGQQQQNVDSEVQGFLDDLNDYAFIIGFSPEEVEAEKKKLLLFKKKEDMREYVKGFQKEAMDFKKARRTS